MTQQVVATAQPSSTQQPQQVQTASAAQANSQLTVTASRAGAVLAGNAVTNLQVARLVSVAFLHSACPFFLFQWAMWRF